MSKKVQFIGIGLQGNEFVKNNENSPLVTSSHYIEQLTKTMDVDSDAFTLLFVENNERDLQQCYQFAKSFQFDCLSVVVLPTRGESLHSHCHKWLLDLEKRIDLLIALNKPLQVDCMLLKETDLFDAITVIIDLISENNLINVDVKDIKTVSYGAKEIGFYSFEIERRGKVISADDVITHLLSKSHTENKKINQFIEYFKEFLNQEFIISNKNKSQFIPNLLEKLDDEERRNAFEMVITAIKNREEIYRVLAEKLEQSLIDKLSSSKYQDWKLITINKNGDTILPIYISNDKYSFDICFESNGRTYCGLRFKESVNEELKERDNEILNKIIIEGAERATTKYPIWFYPNYPITDKWNEKSWTQLASDVDSVTKDFWNPIEMLLDGLNKAESGK